MAPEEDCGQSWRDSIVMGQARIIVKDLQPGRSFDEMYHGGEPWSCPSAQDSSRQPATQCTVWR